MKLGAFFIEILPLLAFFVGYQYFGLLMAAALSAALGAGVLLLARWRDGRGEGEGVLRQCAEGLQIGGGTACGQDVTTGGLAARM